MRNAQRVSGRIGGTLSGQADHVGLGALEEGEQRAHLTPQLGNLPAQGSEGVLALRALALAIERQRRADRLTHYVTPIAEQRD